MFLKVSLDSELRSSAGMVGGSEVNLNTNGGGVGTVRANVFDLYLFSPRGEQPSALPTSVSLRVFPDKGRFGEVQASIGIPAEYKCLEMTGVDSINFTNDAQNGLEFRRAKNTTNFFCSWKDQDFLKKARTIIEPSLSIARTTKGRVICLGANTANGRIEAKVVENVRRGRVSAVISLEK